MYVCMYIRLIQLANLLYLNAKWKQAKRKEKSIYNTQQWRRRRTRRLLRKHYTHTHKQNEWLVVVYIDFKLALQFHFCVYFRNAILITTTMMMMMMKKKKKKTINLYIMVKQKAIWFRNEWKQQPHQLAAFFLWKWYLLIIIAFRQNNNNNNNNNATRNIAI